MKHYLSHKSLLLALAAMVFVVTGCPNNDYTVELKPAGPAIVRTLTFYRQDGVNQITGSPNYKPFDPAELAMIAAQYPSGSLTNHGDWHVVQSEFGSRMPDDVGGVGTYTNLETSLGSAGFYGERFRGNDDLAGMAEKRFKAADQLTDLLIGWSQAELGRERGFWQLREFLDYNLRQDLKNASSYWWEAQVMNSHGTNANEEFAVRFGQYLYERGYFTLAELPVVEKMFLENDSVAGQKWLQRLVARKMGLPDVAAIPASLAFLADDAAMERSFTNYFVHTDLYLAQAKELKKKTPTGADQPPPDPDAVMGVLIGQLMGIDFKLFGEGEDHLTVKLSLPSAPLHSNGQWDESSGQVVWNSDIEGRTNGDFLPVACYASWAQEAGNFQMAHFGKMAFTGDGLVSYCMWRCTVDDRRGREWDDFVAGLTPGDDLQAKVKAFRFTGEDASTTNAVTSAYPRGLLESALK